MSDLLNVNVNNHTEKKNGLTYLSWAWAWAEVLKADPLATWEAVEFNGMPCTFLPDTSAMVKTVVTIKGHSKSCWLPVMNHRNQAIKGPDAFAINTAIVRCLTKAISMHGLGLYIYAGEDMPEEDKPQPEQKLVDAEDSYEAEFLPKMREASMNGNSALQSAFKSLPAEGHLKVAFWQKHQKALKAAAAKAEAQVEEMAGQS